MQLTTEADMVFTVIADQSLGSLHCCKHFYNILKLMEESCITGIKYKTQWNVMNNGLQRCQEGVIVNTM